VEDTSKKHSRKCEPETHLECETVETCIDVVEPIMKDVKKEKKTSYSADALVVVPTVQYSVSENIVVEGGIGYANIDNEDYLAFKAGIGVYAPIRHNLSIRGGVEYLNMDVVDGLVGSLGVQYTF